MPDMTLKNPSEAGRRAENAPPCGWKWQHPTSGRLFSGTNLEEFAACVQRALLDLGEDPSLAKSQIHEATARSLSERGHHDLVQTVKKVPREPGQYASGAKAAFLKWWRESPVYGLIHGKASRGEAVFVDQAEGDRRAAICVNCPHNVIPAEPPPTPGLRRVGCRGVEKGNP